MRQKKGFTLIEAIVSLLLFSLVLVVFMSIMMPTLTIQRKAVVKAQNVLEDTQQINEESATITGEEVIVVKWSNGEIRATGKSYKVDQDEEKTKLKYFKADSIEVK
ncbi:MAG: prepilin-type N-terminal cleavage/methylation domain-containing protein [Cellulosilyticaceae bacterium]